MIAMAEGGHKVDWGKKKMSASRVPAGERKVWGIFFSPWDGFTSLLFSPPELRPELWGAPLGAAEYILGILGSSKACEGHESHHQIVWLAWAFWEMERWRLRRPIGDVGGALAPKGE